MRSSTPYSQTFLFHFFHQKPFIIMTVFPLHRTNSRRLEEAPLVTAMIEVEEISLKSNGHTTVLARDESGRLHSFCWMRNWDFDLCVGGRFIVEFRDAIAGRHNYRTAEGILPYCYTGRYLTKVVPV